MIIEQIEKYARAHFERPIKWPRNSIILASFPKSGNTWFRFLTANMILATIESKDYREVNFQNLSHFSPEIRNNRNLKNLVESALAPTFLKTHFYYTHYFNKRDAILLFREPKKSLYSYYNYLKGEHSKNYKSFMDFLKSPRVGIDSWILFHDSWLEKANITVDYDAIIKNQLETLPLIYEYFGHVIPSEIYQLAINNSSRKSMASLEKKYGDPYKKNKEFQFVSQKADRYEVTLEESEAFELIDQKCSSLYQEAVKFSKFHFADL